MKNRFDAIIILGGGRYNNDELTPLSIQRLEKGLQIYKEKNIPRIIVLGGPYSTYSKDAIRFNKTGAQLRKEYLIKHGANPKDVIKVENGRDTICEAFAAREKANKKGLKKLILATSDKHMKRALWIFRRIFGSTFSIVGKMVPCGNILISAEEKDYLEVTQEFFKDFAKEIPFPNLASWFRIHKTLYAKFKEIHDKYHPAGKESQAYAGIIRKAGEKLNSEKWP